ncbi:unnamed protein product [Oikopleura dioica]|nr:unnamed protein product [Oikopleura dioica]
MVPINEVRNAANIDKKFRWTKEADLALKDIQMRMSTTPVVSFPNTNHMFHLYTDASLYAVGGILIQEYDGRVNLVSAISHTFTRAERRWNVSEKEMYGILWCCERLEKLLRGRFFHVHTDHRCLVYLNKRKFKNSKIHRWQTRLEEFDFHVSYIKGSENTFADFMSRRPGENDKALDYEADIPAGREYSISNDSPIRIFVPFWNNSQFPDKLRLTASTVHKISVKSLTAPKTIPLVSANFSNLSEFQLQDSALSKIIKKLESGSGILDVNSILPESDHRKPSLVKYQKSLFLDHVTSALMVNLRSGSRGVVPEAVKSHFLYVSHDLAGHLGVPRVLEKLEDLWWPTIEKDVENYVHSCVPCLRRKGSAGHRIKPPLGQLRRGKKPGQSIHIDYAHMTPSSGYKFYLVAVCSFSRYAWCIPCRSDTAATAARALLYKVFLPMDFLPDNLHSDRGTHFCSATVSEMCKLNGIKHTISTAFHPQSNSFAERANRTIKNSLYCMVNSPGKRNWVDCVPHVMRSLNSVKNKSTGVSPREVWFGRKSEFTNANGDSMTATSPKVFGLNVAELAKKVEKLVTLSMAAADKSMEQRLKNQPAPKPIPDGAAIYIKRDQLTDPRAKKEKWVGPLRAIKSNSWVVLVEDKNGARDFIHREHCVHASERISDLKWIEEFEDMYIFPHLTDIVKDKIPQKSPISKPAVEISSPKSQGGRINLESTPMPKSNKPPRLSMSPIVPAQTDSNSSGLHLNSSASSGGSVIPMKLGVDGGTMYETATDSSMIPEVVASEDTLISRHFNSNNDTATAVRHDNFDSQPNKTSGKRPRVDSPDSSAAKVAPPKRKSTRERKQTTRLSIQSSKGKTYV